MAVLSLIYSSWHFANHFEKEKSAELNSALQSLYSVCSAFSLLQCRAAADCHADCRNRAGCSRWVVADHTRLVRTEHALTGHAQRLRRGVGNVRSVRRRAVRRRGVRKRVAALRTGGQHVVDDPVPAGAWAAVIQIEQRRRKSDR